MKIAVFGATGATGRQVVQQALNRGYNVAALVRRPLNINDPRLMVVQNELSNSQSVRKVVEDSDLVVSLVSFTPKIFGKKSTGIYTHTARLLVEAMHVMSVKRLAFCTSAGVEDDPGEFWLYRHLIKPFYLQKSYENMRDAETLIRVTPLDWSLVRPARLTNGALTGQFRVSARLRPTGGTSISRADLAFFLLNQAGSDEWVRKTPTLAY